METPINSDDNLGRAINNILDLKLSGFTAKEVYLNAIHLGTQAAMAVFLPLYGESGEMPNGNEFGKFVADFAWTICQEAESHLEKVIDENAA